MIDFLQRNPTDLKLGKDKLFFLIFMVIFVIMHIVIIL